MKTTSLQHSEPTSALYHAPTLLKNALILTGKILIFLLFCVHAFNAEYCPKYQLIREVKKFCVTGLYTIAVDLRFSWGLENTSR